MEEVAVRLKDQFDFTIVTAKLRKDAPRTGYLVSPSPLAGGEGGVRVMRVGLGRPIDKWLFPFLAPFAVRRVRPQIVHAVLESFAGLALVFSKSLFRNAKYILTCQSTNTSLLVRLMHRRADRVTVISRALSERALRYGRADALLIPNGIDGVLIARACADFKKIPGRILFVGRLEPMKGVDTLIRAFARLFPLTQPSLHGGEGVHLRIVGRGSEEAALKRLAKDLGLAERVTFVGFVPMPQVYEEFAQAQVFCALSRSEALGNVFLEAQAAGCAVVATRVGGIPDIIEDGRTGLLVASDDAEAAAQALESVLTDQHKWAILAEAGVANARSYDWSGIVERYAEVYRSLA